LLEVLAEGLREVLALLGVDVPGLRQLFFGVCLLLVVMLLPDGVWPWLARKLRITEGKR
jgi:branched-chain amino acid transport system permease protein